MTVFLAFALPLALPSLVTASLSGQSIRTKYGDVKGYPAFSSQPTGNLTNWQDITVWKGIPFAASTAGNNRWKAPQPAASWNETLLASDYGPVCPSSTSNTNYTISEDCLNLNIWSAANSSDAKLPVVMWSYPAASAARDALFDGAGMANAGVVFVNYNYRTGPFGWMAHPQLSEEFLASTGHNSSGNWGMLDQFAALNWIRENIEGFGGDPEHITVMGQSAGSAATYHILNSPLTKGLIVGAIIESGVRDPHDPLASSLAENYVNLTASLSQGVDFLNTLNVSDVQAARNIPFEDLVSVSGSFMTGWSWSATLDHYAVPATYYETLLEGAANQVPVLTGNTKDESGASYGLNLTLSAYLSDLNSTFGNWAERFFAQYSANDSITAPGAYNSQWTDRSNVGTWLWSQLWYTSSSQPVYTYFWDHAPPGQDQGAHHESEINYVLNNLYGTDLPWTADDYAIAKTMNAYWVNFIKTGDPNGEGLVSWPRSGTDQKMQRVGNAFESIPVASDAKVKLFEDWFSGLSTK